MIRFAKTGTNARSRRNLLAQMGVLSVGAGLLFAGCGGGNSNNNNTNQPYSGALTRANSQMRAVEQAYLNLLAGRQPYNLPPQQARLLPTPQVDAQNAVLQSQGKTFTPTPVGSVQDVSIPGPVTPLASRMYTPTGTGPFPVLVYFHGGGWVLGSIDQYDSSARALCSKAQCVVISVGYRLGPESKFPAAHDDAYAATQYVINNAAQFGGDPARVAVGGESAGGNLASAVCLQVLQNGGKMPVYQLVIYPVAGNNMNTPSYLANANAITLNVPLIQYFLTNYLNSMTEAADPRIDLLGATFGSTLPPATVITDDIDPLMSEGQAYAQKLQAAGITTRYQNYTGVAHEFFGLDATVDTAKTAQQYAADGLNTVFRK